MNANELKLKDLHERLVQDHLEIVKKLKSIIASEKDHIIAARRILQLYDGEVTEHARLEEDEFVAICGEMNISLDGEAIRFAHEMLDQQAESLREEVVNFREGDGIDRIMKEIRLLEEIIVDHFREEENHIFPGFKNEFRMDEEDGR
jgi:hypothetical protein